MKLGLSSYAFGWAIGFGDIRPPHPLDQLGLLQRAAALGAQTLQIADNLPLEDLTAERLDHLRREADAHHIRLEVGARRLTVERMTRYGQTASMLDSPFVRFVIDDWDYHPTLEEVREVIRTGLPALEGRTLAIENHDRFPAASLRSLLESIGSEQVGICLDTANSLGAGEGIETVLRHLGPWTVNVHLKDIAIRRIDTLMGFHVEGRPAGEGQLDIPAILTELRHCGRCRSATLELWTPAEATLDQTIAKESEWVERSWRFLQPLIQQNDHASTDVLP